MALFVDGPGATVDSLVQHDSNVLSVSGAEGINLTTKLLLAQETLGIELDALLSRSHPREWYIGAVRFYNLEHVTWSPALRLWLIHEALSLVYLDAYYSQLNDRHQARAKQYQILSRSARATFEESGIGFVRDPVRQPPQPLVSTVPAAETGGTFYFAVTYQNQAGEESSPSSVLSTDLTDGTAADLTVSTLPPKVVGWNFYGGTVPGNLFQQNTELLAPDADWCYLPSLANSTGNQPSDGQMPNEVRRIPRLLQRG
ncbi:MAG: hypothetical protein M3Z09_11990 [Acidobacteriota bacterium]|nr:hypothetical protein [Acidobacteriota bacterium]